MLYVDRTGIPWRYLPHDFALWETVYGYFAAWQKNGIFDQLICILRQLVRPAEGRNGEPSACVLDAQSVKTSANVPAAGQGIDAGRRGYCFAASTPGAGALWPLCDPDTPDLDEDDDGSEDP
ncbi:hypothetical protein Save01_04041 [Streptomyces avermitilis]